MSSDIRAIFESSELPTSKYDTYFPAYDELFGAYRSRPITFVEVGILGGGSLQAWKKYFHPESRIIGIDLNPALKESLGRRGFELFIGDQSNPAFWRDFYAAVGSIDVLLDDGGHSNLQTWTTLKCCLPHIKDGGVVVVEDTHASYMEAFGNPSRRSFVSRAKEIVDEVNYRSYQIDDDDRRQKGSSNLEGVNISGSVHSVKFFESIVAFSIDRRLTKVSTRADFGSKELLPTQSVPEDLRYKGIRDPDLGRIRMRTLLQRLIAKIRRTFES